MNFAGEIFFNSMEYSGTTIDEFFNEIDPDIVIDYNLKVGLQYLPSAVDINEVNLIIRIIDDPMDFLADASLIVGVIKGLYSMTKHIFKYRGKNNVEPYVNGTIINNNTTINIYYIDKSNLDDLMDDDIQKKLMSALKAEESLDVSLSEMKENEN